MASNNLPTRINISTFIFLFLISQCKATSRPLTPSSVHFGGLDPPLFFHPSPENMAELPSLDSQLPSGVPAFPQPPPPPPSLPLPGSDNVFSPPSLPLPGSDNTFSPGLHYPFPRLLPVPKFPPFPYIPTLPVVPAATQAQAAAAAAAAAAP